jgi:hypothetical protein
MIFGVAAGLFQIIEEVQESADIHPAVEQITQHELEWFNEQLSAPGRLNRTRSKGWYRRNPREFVGLKKAPAIV